MKEETEKMVRVTIRMPVKQRDQLAKRAEKAGVPMAEYVRSVLTKKVLAMRRIFPMKALPSLEYRRQRFVPENNICSNGKRTKTVKRCFQRL